MVYLDNAATSYPKPKRVISELERCVRHYCGNPGRSAHRLSYLASEKIYEARERVASLLDYESPEHVIFTQNATHALNLAIKTSITEKCHVITSDIEHNSVIRPLEKLKRTLGIEYSNFKSGCNIEAEIEKCIRDDTKFIISTLRSNVSGEDVPPDILSRLAKKYRLKLIVDASQFIGHESISLKSTPIDILCAPGHKGLFGIQGSGFFVMTDNEFRDSFIEGGSGSDSLNPQMPPLLPERYEAGTLSTPAIATLSEGISFVCEVGISEIKNKINLLEDMLRDRLDSLGKVKLHANHGGICSFTADGVAVDALARELDRRGICVRAGLHCAPSAHIKLGTVTGGTVRVSLSYLNSRRDIDCLYKALSDILI